jgi:hypothetical protein
MISMVSFERLRLTNSRPSLREIRLASLSRASRLVVPQESGLIQWCSATKIDLLFDADVISPCTVPRSSLLLLVLIHHRLVVAHSVIAASLAQASALS